MNSFLNNLVFGWLPFAAFWFGVFVLTFWLIKRCVKEKDQALLLFASVLILGSLFISNISFAISSKGMMNGAMMGGMMNSGMINAKMMEEMVEMHKECAKGSMMSGSSSKTDDTASGNSVDHASHHKN